MAGPDQEKIMNTRKEKSPEAAGLQVRGSLENIPVSQFQ
jgi:hypothetical protein